MDLKTVTSTVQTLSPSQKEIVLEVGAEEVEREFERILDLFATRAKIPGFRQGRVPREVVRQRFAAEMERTLIDELAPEALKSSLREHRLEPVGIPVLRDIERTPGQPLRFRAVIEVWPEFELADYRKIKVEKKDVRVEDEEVASALEQIRQSSAEYVPVEGRGVVEGDYVAVEVQGMETASKRKYPKEKVVILAGPSDDNPLAAQLVGLPQAGEGAFQLTYPDGHPDKRLAGKEMATQVKILAIKEKKVPPLDDDLAKSLGDYETLEDLRRRVREDLLKTKEKASRGEAAQEVLKRLAEQVPDELPESVVEREMQDLLRKFLQSPGSQGLRAGGREELEDIKKKLHSQAVANLKNHLVLKEVADKESLRVSEEDLQAEIGALAQANRLPPAGLRSRLEEEGRLDSLRETILFRRAVDFLVDQAIIKG
ncbi:MAG TPA: trigger factor, partial [Acidobacteriota bacterium]